MTNETANATVSATDAAIQNTPKVVRRGIGSARGTTRLKFSHEHAKPNGLFIAHLDSVEVRTIQIGEEAKGMPSFNGLEIPKLVLTFASNEDEVAKRHFVTLQFTAVESNSNTIPGGKEEWKINSIFDWMKHLLDVYVLKGRDLSDEEEAALALPFADFDDQGEYSPVEPETVIAGWKTLFENFENIMNRGRDGQPYYKSKDGKPISIWIKLLRYVKNNKKGWAPINNGELSFPAFVGEGCVEIFKANVAPSMRVDLIKENIRPMNIEKPKTPNMPVPGMGMSPMGGGVPIGDPMMANPMDADIMAAAVDDNPF